MFEINSGLTWDDWCYTSQHNLALRHLDSSNSEMAKKEFEEGGTGDACSLVIKNLGPYHLQVDAAVQDLLHDRWPALRMQLLHYREALTSCHGKLTKATTQQEKKDCLTAIFNLFLAEWIFSCKELNPRFHDCYFLVIEHPDAHKSYDYHGYPLGKCGTGVPWKVHHLMTRVFTYNCVWSFEDNFLSLVGRIQNFRTRNQEREYPNPIPNDGIPGSYYVVGTLALSAVAAVAYYLFSSSKEPSKSDT